MLIVFFRALILYAIIIFALRLMGKRQLGQLQPSEFVVTILISNIASLPIEDINIPMLVGAVPIFALVGFELFMSTMTLHNRKLRKFVSGNPMIIIKDGEIQQNQMAKLRFSIDDLMESLREQGIFDVTDVYYAIVETTGKISVLQKKDKLTVTLEDMKIKKPDTPPPIVIISDGELIEKSIADYALNINKINGIIKEKGTTKDQIFLMTIDQNYKSFIAIKE